MPDIGYVSFKDDLIREAIKQAPDASTLIFPSRAAASAAEQAYYESWIFDDKQFISIDDLKQKLTVYPLPRLQDDKRLICLYQAMNDEDRDYYHIYRFEDIVGWGQQFFRFYEELAEELVPPERLLNPDPHDADLRLQLWQSDSIERTNLILRSYLELIHSKGFFDPIGIDLLQFLEIPQAPRSYLFVNQYYYSGFEKELINRLEASGNPCKIIFQAPEGSFDLENLRAKELSLDLLLDSADYRTKQIQYTQRDSEEEMILALMQDIHAQPQLKAGRSALIDSQFSASYYSKDFEGILVPRSGKQPFCESFLYRYFAAINRDLEAISQTRREAYIPTRNILELCAAEGFLDYYGVGDKALLKSQLLDLAARDYLYVDLALDLFKMDDKLEKKKELKSLLSSYFQDLILFSRLKSVGDLIDLIDTDAGIKLNRLLSPAELSSSDAAERFLEKLANLASIERLNIIEDWEDLFREGGLSLAAGILGLLLDSLKTVSITWKYQRLQEDYVEITNLLDSRNSSYDKLIFFNTLEGQIPSAPEPVWIINESQRKRLGLKTYEEIRAWERYYFFRLLFTSTTCSIYAYQNVERDIQVSSFLAELISKIESGTMPDSLLNLDLKTCPKSPSLSLEQYYAARQKNSSSGRFLGLSSKWNKKVQAEFFNLPYDPVNDFGGIKTIHGTHYKLKQLIKSPFVWYMQDYKRLSEAQTELKLTVSRKVFGTIIHEFMSLLMKDLAGEHKSYSRIRSHLGDKAVLQRSLLDMLESPLWQYRLPHNYNWDFLSGIIAGSVVQTVYWFFTGWLPKLLNDSRFVLIPEQEKQTREEQNSKRLPIRKICEEDFTLLLNGKADLRIELDHRVFIIDFKTGANDLDQLIIYEWFYYLLEDKRSADEIESYICNILNQEVSTGVIDDKKRDKLKTKIEDSIGSIVSEGYQVAKTASDRLQFREISRTDLYSKRLGGSDE